MYRKNTLSQRTNPPPKQQQGLALLASLILISLVAIVGMTMLEKSRDNQDIAGANIRYEMVFQAAENTLKQAKLFLQHIEEKPIVTENADQGREFAKNFDFSHITALNSPAYHPESAFIWQRGALEDKVCGTNQCRSGINFRDYLQNDEDIWTDYAIISQFNQNIEPTNYLHHIYTYTFIQSLEQADQSTGGMGADGNLDSTMNNQRHYLITTKAVGYPPDAKINTENARETVLLQAVYTQQY